MLEHDYDSATCLAEMVARLILSTIKVCMNVVSTLAEKDSFHKLLIQNAQVGNDDVKLYQMVLKSLCRLNGKKEMQEALITQDIKVMTDCFGAFRGSCCVESAVYQWMATPLGINGHR